MATILISAPSLDPHRNVSGVSSVVRMILSVLSRQHEFIHLELGSEQGKTRFSRLGNTLKKIFSGLRLCLGANYDVFHSNTAANKPSLVRDSVFILIARIRRKACIWHVHGGDYMTTPAHGLMRYFIRLLAIIAGNIVVLSETERDFFIKNYNVKVDSVKTIYNGIIQPDNTRPFFHVSLDKNISIIYAGRLAEEKGINILIEALSQINDSEMITFNIFGTGKWKSEIVNLSSNKLNVNYGGVLSPNDIQSQMLDHAVLILPSLRGEGMPMAVIEAMSMGVVPICTSLASIPEIVQNGVNGILIKPTADNLLFAIRALAKDPSATLQMSKNAQEFAREHFDAVKNFAEFGRMYTKLSKRRQNST